MNIGIGEKVKELRQDKGISLNEVSNRAELSATYLSKFERGLVPINVDNLQKVCEALGVTIQYFIGTPKSSGAEVIRSYERQVDLEGDSYIHYNLSNIEDCGDFLPRYVDLLPRSDCGRNIQSSPHEGEELVYVLQGTMELWVAGIKYVLTEGDSAHYLSTIPHKWVNTTNQVVHLLTINDTNFYLQA